MEPILLGNKTIDEIERDMFINGGQPTVHVGLVQQLVQQVEDLSLEVDVLTEQLNDAASCDDFELELQDVINLADRMMTKFRENFDDNPQQEYSKHEVSMILEQFQIEVKDFIRNY